MKRAVLVLLAGCDWSLHRMQEPAKCTVDGTTALLPHGSCNLTPPEGTVAIDPPPAAPPVTRALLGRGRDRFARICAACHGVNADGDAPVARAMTQRRPPSLVDATAVNLTDERILSVIASGYGLMPEYASSLTPADRYAVLHYVRAIQHREVAFDDLTPTQQAEARKWLP
jgi:mono/diheme cytochrome c family protein